MKKATILTASLFLILFGYTQIKSSLEKKVLMEAHDEIIIKTGDASITMKKNGSIIIKGSNIQLDGSKSVNAKASGEIILKGSKINEN